MEQNYRLTIAYDGSRFFGWERQPDKDTIQGKLEAVLGTLQGYPVNVIGAGRTDAGVHARAMTANVVLDVTETPDALRDYLNRYLPDAIAVREVKEAAPRFHARYNALGKTYRYTCHTGPVKPVFDRKYVTLLDYDPDVEKMRQAAAYLLGENDFASFCGNPRMKKSTVRLVDHIAIERRKDRVVFTFHGTGFLQNMVRIMVGTLLEVGRGYWTPEQVRDILAAHGVKHLYLENKATLAYADRVRAALPGVEVDTGAVLSDAIDAIRACQPNAVIYIQGLIPLNEDVIAATGGASYLTNEHLRVYNDLMQQVAEEKQVVFLDLEPEFTGPDGQLPADASNDGVHLKKAYCQAWLEYLKTHTVSYETLYPTQEAQV